MTRSKRSAAQIETKVKTWLKRHDPTYVEKMKALSKDEGAKTKRNDAGRVRRAGHAATHTIFKKFSPLTDTEGNVYRWNDTYKRLIKDGKFVVRRARNGSVHYMPFETEEDLESSKYDEPILSETDIKLYENVEKLLNGDEELDQKMRTRKFMVERTLTDEDCFWKKLSPAEKRKLIKKLRQRSVK